MVDMELRMIENDTTRLKLLPVCDCGYIFRDGVIGYEDIHKMNNEIKVVHRSIEPPMCPNCKKRIECIEYYDDIKKYYIKEGF